MPMNRAMARVPRAAALGGTSEITAGGSNADASAARWRALIAESPIGIYEQDLDGRCTFVNPAFQRILGLSADDALGFGWCRVVHPEDLDTLTAMQSEPPPADGARAVELRVIRNDGSRRNVSARTVPLRGDDGVITGYLGTLEDVTDRKLL